MQHTYVYFKCEAHLFVSAARPHVSPYHKPATGKPEIALISSCGGAVMTSFAELWPAAEGCSAEKLSTLYECLTSCASTASAIKTVAFCAVAASSTQSASHYISDMQHLAASALSATCNCANAKWLYCSYGCIISRQVTMRMQAGSIIACSHSHDVLVRYVYTHIIKIGSLV